MALFSSRSIARGSDNYVATGKGHPERSKDARRSAFLTTNAAVIAIVEIHELIQRLADEGKAVVMISSYLPEIMALSDRILVSRQGKVVEEFSALDATEEKIMYAAVH